jgi:hypothetical protein
MPEIGGVEYMTVQLDGSLHTGTALMPLIVAGTAGSGFGGGFTLVGAFYQAGTTTGAGTAFTLALVHGGYMGTVLGGTVGGLIGGTASVFASDTVYPFTLVAAQTRFAEGDSLSIRKVASGVNQSPAGVLHLQFVRGR